MEKFMIGNSVVYGNLVCKPSHLTEIGEKSFFKEVDKSLKKNNLEQYRKKALKKSNLKRGVTIGMDYFIIEQVSA